MSAEAVALVCTATAPQTAHHTRATGLPETPTRGKATAAKAGRRTRNPERAAKEAGDEPEAHPGTRAAAMTEAGAARRRARARPRTWGKQAPGGAEPLPQPNHRTPPTRYQRSRLHIEYNRQMLTCQGGEARNLLTGHNYASRTGALRVKRSQLRRRLYS
jgi:hypothetical protein